MYFFILCILCLCTVFVLSVLFYIAVSFVFLYKFTDRCHREKNPVALNIISYRIIYIIQYHISYRIYHISYRNISYIISCHVISCHISYIIYYISYHILSYIILLNIIRKTSFLHTDHHFSPL
jgi:hypothetical protein